MAWRHGDRERGEDDQYPGLSIEFDDEAEDADDDADPDVPASASASISAHTYVYADADPTPDAPAAGGTASPELIATRPASRWSRIPLRHRVTATITVLAVVAGSVVAIRLDQAARRRAAERFTLSVVDDHYQPAISEVGLDMALTLVDNGPAPVTAEFVQVSQPGLSLAFYPVEVPLPVGTPTEFTLVGVFDCHDTKDPDASTVEVTVVGQTGTSSVVLGLKSGLGSVPPKGWQTQRSAFCAEANTSGR